MFFKQNLYILSVEDNYIILDSNVSTFKERRVINDGL